MDNKAAHFLCKCGSSVTELQNPYKLRYPDCPDCGEMMDYLKEGPYNNRSVTGHFGEPIIMYSVGLIPGEEAAFRKANREIDLTDQGVPIAKTRQEKKQILKYFDYEERN